MQVDILTRIPHTLPLEEVLSLLNLDDSFAEEVDALRLRVLAVSNPKAMLRPARITARGEREVMVEDMRFVSRVLSVNFDKVETVYPYVITCGREAYELSLSLDDPLERYWVDTMCEMLLRQASEYTHQYMTQKYGIGQAYFVSPGSLPDWPTGQQKPLFALLGDVRGEVGVELNDSCLMLPIKSISGMYFESEEHYVNCEMCPREGCPSRQAPFDPDLAMSKYGI